MIYIDKTKFTVDGVDVYPDHESDTQFWYVPGTIRLAERDKRKVLSYLWYTDSVSDSDGTGFLNFEVNTAVSDATIKKIKTEISSRKKIPIESIQLSTVTYTGGAVTFSVLGPVAKKASDLQNDASVLYQSDEQIVFTAGSSSLVGDNAAVCSVKFTRQGKLAAAMGEAIRKGSNSIAALYKLEFLAMRPSVTFTVQGTLEKTVKDFNIALQGSIPLGKFILDLGVQAQWKEIMKKTDLKITVVNFSGEESEGLKWAQQVLLDYVLKNFFEVQIGDQGNFIPLGDNEEAAQAVDDAKEVEQSAQDKVDESGGDKTGDGKKDGDSGTEKDEGEKGKDEGGDQGDGGKSGGTTTTQTGSSGGGAVKELVKAATTYIPKVKVRASYYQGRQVNSIDFVYSEMKAKKYPVLPQALVLEGLGDEAARKTYINEVNRSQIPFGLPYNVTVSIPEDADRSKAGLQTLNVQGRYPGSAPQDRQSTKNLTVSAGKTGGENPFAFQYEPGGSGQVNYRADFVFKPGDEWQADAFQYSIEGSSDNGLIVAMPEAVVEFVALDVRLGSDFVWDQSDQAVVTLTSAKWKGDKRVVFQNGGETAQTLKIRGDAKQKDAPISYKVELKKNNKVVYSYGPETAPDKQITVHDRFASHTPVFFSAGFAADSVNITLSYEDGDFVWEDQFQLDKGQKNVKRVVPAMKEFRKASDLKVKYEIMTDDGQTFEKVAQGGQHVTVNFKSSAASQ